MLKGGGRGKEAGIFKPKGDFKDANNKGGKFVEILHEALNEPVGPNGEKLWQYFDTVTLADIPKKR